MWETEGANKGKSPKCLYLEHKDLTHSAPSHSTPSLFRVYIYIYMCSSKNTVYKIRAGAEKVRLERNVYLKLGNLSILLFVISHGAYVWKSGIEDHPPEAWQPKKYLKYLKGIHKDRPEAKSPFYGPSLRENVADQSEPRKKNRRNYYCFKDKCWDTGMQTTF